MKAFLPAVALLALSACATLPQTSAPQPGQAVFSDIRLDSEIPGQAKLTKPQYENPILPGFYPDPSITRAGDDYYLINSSFAYYPGIPVFHSRDLVHWKQIGNAIDRPGMLDFSGLATSRGVFAPAISHHDGLFYIINTCVDCGGNFVITARDPAGPWSDPVWLNFGGIDPSIFWDDDGKAWVVWNDSPEGQPLYEGHRAIWIQQFDPAKMQMVGEKHVVVNGGVDISKKPVWIEGPHIYKVDGRYYLMAAEGGTSVNHSEVILSSEKIGGPYVPYAGNPILTQRDLDPARPMPITSAGHADLVQTPNGDWHAIFLAVQPYEGNLYNAGRETFMLPVNWQKDAQGIAWPIILPKGMAIPAAVDLPDLPGQVQEPHYTRYSHHFGYSYGGVTPLDWLQIRTPKSDFLTVLNDETIGLTALPEAIGDVQSHPAFIGLRQKHVNATFSTVVNYQPLKEGDRAGILAVQNDDFYIFYGLAMRNGKTVLEVTRRAGRSDPLDGLVIASQPAPVGPVSLKADIRAGRATFSYGKGTTIAADVDVTNLSTDKAGGFVGTLIGPYAYGKRP
ncbi:glycoside hydrolase family 43 protein [Asticcacaulis taihuensis]|uniref:Alpha-N-arabinofuranosidase n=1 Tax=Asticcacaulis taihuensis TaxID=260084 RepID=A0A1G4RVI2_9CAUL|nr:glycoside hydrolase family 43 protein [Asticcacaulis taihuensis]SCW60766.1 alpha-N-arabinofuranosidase [Asticcacaulis taihuensis]